MKTLLKWADYKFSSANINVALGLVTSQAKLFLDQNVTNWIECLFCNQHPGALILNNVFNAYNSNKFSVFIHKNFVSSWKTLQVVFL